MDRARKPLAQQAPKQRLRRVESVVRRQPCAPVSSIRPMNKASIKPSDLAKNKVIQRVDFNEKPKNLKKETKENGTLVKIPAGNKRAVATLKYSNIPASGIPAVTKRSTAASVKEGPRVLDKPRLSVSLDLPFPSDISCIEPVTDHSLLISTPCTEVSGKYKTKPSKQVEFDDTVEKYIFKLKQDTGITKLYEKSRKIVPKISCFIEEEKLLEDKEMENAIELLDASVFLSSNNYDYILCPIASADAGNGYNYMCGSSCDSAAREHCRANEDTCRFAFDKQLSLLGSPPRPSNCVIHADTDLIKFSPS